MTFSIAAGGTRDEALAELEAVSYSDGLGEKVRDAIAGCLRSAASQAPDDGQRIVYSVTARGHSADGQIPYLSAQLTGQYVPAPQAG